EAGAAAPGDECHWEGRLCLPRGFAAAHDDVQVLGSAHPPNRSGELHCDSEEMNSQLFGDLEQRFVMLARYDEHVPVVDGLDVHESDCVRILMAQRHLGGALDQVAEGANFFVYHGSLGCVCCVRMAGRMPNRRVAESPSRRVVPIFQSWPLPAKPSASPPRASRAISSSVRTAPCSCRGGSTTRRSSSSARTRSFSRSRALGMKRS